MENLPSMADGMHTETNNNDPEYNSPVVTTQDSSTQTTSELSLVSTNSHLSGLSFEESNCNNSQVSPPRSRTQLPVNCQPATEFCIRRIQKELNQMIDDAPPNCIAFVKHNCMQHWHATIRGPSGSPYENGYFHLDITFPRDYPFVPPRVRFLTRIYHCNIGEGGVICLDILGKKWSPALTVPKILLSISSLLADCNPNDPMVPSIAQEYEKNRRHHDHIARQWAKRFAMAENFPSDEDESD